MSSAKDIERSLLTEHLRYTPLTLLDDIINMVNDVVNNIVDNLENFLLSNDGDTLGFAARAAADNRIPDTDGHGKPEYPEMRGEIEEGVHQLETLLQSAVDKNYDIMELWALRNALVVPEELVPWVRLEHYQNLAIPSPDAQTPTPESLLALRRKAQETKKLQLALFAEKQRNDALLSQLRALLSLPPATSTEPKPEQHSSPVRGGAQVAPPPSSDAGSFSFLTAPPAAQVLGVSFNASASATSRGPLEASTAFTLSQLPALRNLIATLKPKLAGASLHSNPPRDAVAGADSDPRSRARERRDYIETQTRRVLDGRGIVGGGGGFGVSKGRAEEVKALEEWVGGLGRVDEGDKMEE